MTASPSMTRLPGRCSLICCSTAGSLLLAEDCGAAPQPIGQDEAARQTHKRKAITRQTLVFPPIASRAMLIANPFVHNTALSY